MYLELRIKEQFPVLVITLLSVLIGLDFSDLVGIMRSQLTLWPLNTETLRTWGEIFATFSVCISIWILFAHVGISRVRMPILADSMVVFVAPLMILYGNSLIGEKESWRWFYFACGYLAIASATWHWQVRIAMADRELASFARLLRPLGSAGVQNNAAALAASFSNQQLQQALTRAGAVNQAGDQQQALQQKIDDAARQAFLDQWNYPLLMQQLKNQALGVYPTGSFNKSTDTQGILGAVGGLIGNAASLAKAMP